LGGFSSGGIIAYEMARRLTAAGDELGAVIFFDTFHPHVRSRRRSMKDYFSDLIEEGPHYVINLFKNRQERRLVEQDAVVQAEKAKALDGVVPFELRNSQMVHNILSVLQGYEPLSFNGRVIQIAARELWWMYDHLSPDRGWAKVLPQLEIIITGGDHATLVLPPYVAELGSKLTEKIQGPGFSSPLNSQ
jgi:phthiocerol/phenolphthiocerol synthesis type-I polyketide synthase D